MFAVIFTFAFITVHVAAEIPSYIHVCGRRDPNIDQCIVDNINNLKIKICQGIPELDIPSNDPFILGDVAVIDTPDIKLYIKNAEVAGFCEFKINHFQADIDDLYYNVDIVFDQLRANTTYDLNIRILVPIKHQGHLYITADNVGAKVNLHFKLTTRNGKRYTYLSKMKINLNIIDYNAEYLDEKNMGEIIRNFIGQNKKEIIKNLKPAIEEIVTKRIILISNNIVKHFPYEELFPDRI